MAIRNMPAGREVKEAILKQNPTAKIDAMELDVSSIASVNSFVSYYKSSGILAPPYMLSKDNMELQFETNYFGKDVVCIFHIFLMYALMLLWNMLTFSDSVITSTLCI
ncbi:putative very-long-chain 3-oxoacyl-CoA reductase [Helianthus anomalus]